MFAYMQKVCLKKLQKDGADNILTDDILSDIVFLGILRVKSICSSNFLLTF